MFQADAICPGSMGHPSDAGKIGKQLRPQIVILRRTDRVGIIGTTGILGLAPVVIRCATPVLGAT